MKILLFATVFIATLFSGQNCTDTSGKPVTAAPATAAITLPTGFNEYWYAGNAEVCTYEVTQERYGEMRQAEQVNVFVTEDFSRSKQVKLDNAAAAGSERVPVLKLNSIRRFHTGIYDYSIMQSVFTPVSGLPTLKTTTTVQDWCGHIFLQANLEPNGYHQRGFSYFEQEGDQDAHVPLALLEDELWTRIRLNPGAIPTGSLQVIPSAIFTRLRHQSGKPQKAMIEMVSGPQESTLKLTYADIPRSLQINFASAFPYKILGWEESNEGKITSNGQLKATHIGPYWKEHDNVHAPLRDSLKLRF